MTTLDQEDFKQAETELTLPDDDAWAGLLHDEQHANIAVHQ